MRRLLSLAALLLTSAALQTVIFPVAGPLPFFRAQLAWLALVPWFFVVLRTSQTKRSPVLRATRLSYVCGVLWYLGHCYWIYQTMHIYGGLSAPMAALVLILFCLYLGLYHAGFGALLALLWRGYGRRWHPALTVFVTAGLWVAVELARAHITSFPWNLLGYSQVDNAALTSLAPFAGVYSISFIVAAVNAALAIACNKLLPDKDAVVGDSLKAGNVRSAQVLLWPALLVVASSVIAGDCYHAPQPAPGAQAVALQANLDPATTAAAGTQPLEQQLASISIGAVQRASAPPPGLILWPEAPSPYEVHEVLLQQTLTGMAARTAATVIADSNAVDPDPARPHHARIYNAAALFTAQGLYARYDKIHLVPFGEFVPYAELFHFAGGLTEQVGNFDRGTRRAPLSDGKHRFGVFICYESIFPDEVRQLAARGAEVFVNLSDDGWYGDTSAPFQHSNMARMRAIENRRWLLRDTNTGITESIDPYGHVRAAASRHQRLAIALPYSYLGEMTFYTRYGDLFAWACVAVTVAALLGVRRATDAPRE